VPAFALSRGQSLPADPDPAAAQRLRTLPPARSRQNRFYFSNFINNLEAPPAKIDSPLC
jgi:hypothetical protein